jgi:hypothetical protein
MRKNFSDEVNGLLYASEVTKYYQGFRKGEPRPTATTETDGLLASCGGAPKMLLAAQPWRPAPEDPVLTADSRNVNRKTAEEEAIKSRRSSRSSQQVKQLRLLLPRALLIAGGQLGLKLFTRVIHRAVPDTTGELLDRRNYDHTAGKVCTAKTRNRLSVQELGGLVPKSPVT